ncbi:MAG: PPC domain-containing protein, partial [Kiritimatiellia bacterium]
MSTSARTQGPHGLNGSDLYDFYKANLTAGLTYVFETTGEADTYGELYKAANTNASNRVAYNDDISYPSNRNFRITYTPAATGTYYLRVRQYNPSQTGVYSLRYRQLVANDAWDPTDNTASGATLLIPDTATKTHGTHTLNESDSYDWFKVQMTSGRTYTFETTSANNSDTYGELYNSPSATASSRVKYDDDSGSGLQFKLVYTPTTSGTYYLRVRKYTVGTDGVYSLKYGMTVPNTHDLVFCKSTSWSDYLFVANVTNAISGSASFTTNDTIYVTYGFTDRCDNDIVTPFTNTVQLVRYASAAATTYEVIGSVADDFPDMRGGSWWACRSIYIRNPTPGYYGVRVELNRPQMIAETNTANNVFITRYQVAAPTTAQKSLVGVSVAGASSVEVQDGTTVSYTATARFSDGSTQDVTDTARWSVSPSDKADISASGVLSPRQVSERTTVTLSAEYAYNGISRVGSKTVSLVPGGDNGTGVCPFPATVQYPMTPMTIFAQVTVDGEPAQDGDILAAFSSDGELRGRVELGAGGRSPLVVYVTTPGELITFKVWSYLSGEVVPCVTPLSGEIGGERGSPSEPYVIDCGNDPFGTSVRYPNPPMTIVARVVIKGEPAATGDRVGVFCGSELRAKSAVRVEDGIAKVTLAPSVSVNGETLTFKVWDASEEELLNASGALRATIGGEVGSPSERYLIEVSDTVTQSIVFNGSTWQFVSVNVAPEDASPRTVFQNVIGDIDRITCGDKVFKPTWSDADNTLSSIVAGEGYWVKRSTSGAATAAISGRPADVATTRISLVSGWNSVGYVPQAAGSIRDVLADAIASGSINRVVAGDQVFYPSWSDSDNTLLTMQPGIGYWIKATGPVTFAFREPTGSSAAAVLSEISSVGEAHPFGDLRDRDPVSGCMLKASLNLFGVPASYGDATVAAYVVADGVTNEIPCGVAAVNLEGNVIMNVQKYLPVRLAFKVWDAWSGCVYDADGEISFAVGEDEKMDETISVSGGVPVYKVVFELSGVGAGSGVWTGGGALTQLVARASAAVAPTVAGNPGYEFLLWDTDFSCIKCDTTVHAVYQSPVDPTAPDGFAFADSRAYAEKNG